MEIVVLLVVGSSLWMAIDSSNFGAYRNGAAGVAGTHPIMWFLAGILMWIITFPVYLATRPKMMATERENAGRAGSDAPALLGTTLSPPPPVIPAGWHPDPTSRFQYRWWDGERWSEHVSSDGVASTDAL